MSHWIHPEHMLLAWCKQTQTKTKLPETKVITFDIGYRCSDTTPKRDTFYRWPHNIAFLVTLNKTDTHLQRIQKLPHIWPNVQSNCRGRHRGQWRHLWWQVRRYSDVECSRSERSPGRLPSPDQLCSWLLKKYAGYEQNTGGEPLKCPTDNTVRPQ